MAKAKTPAHKVVLTEGKREIIRNLLSEYEIQSAQDIQEALKDLLGGTIEDIYGFDVSEGFISDVTDKILPQIEEWQNSILDDVYPVMYIDAIHYSVRDNGVIVKKAAYVILGLSCEGRKEVLSLAIGENESAKF